MRRISSVLAMLCAFAVNAIPGSAEAAKRVHRGDDFTLDRHAVQTGAGQELSYRSNGAARTRRIDRAGTQIIGGRPAGCPHRFCGCALSLKLFGKIIPRLNLAANWKGFPSATPAPEMIAARNGHVFQLVSHVSGSTWVVWDPNSGGGRIRVHQRSIAGYTIHDPHGGARYAGLR